MASSPSRSSSKDSLPVLLERAVKRVSDMDSGQEAVCALVPDMGRAKEGMRITRGGVQRVLHGLGETVFCLVFVPSPGGSTMIVGIRTPPQFNRVSCRSPSRHLILTPPFWGVPLSGFDAYLGCPCRGRGVWCIAALWSHEFRLPVLTELLLSVAPSLVPISPFFALSVFTVPRPYTRPPV